MRTIAEIESNLSLINQIRDGIRAQIDLLDGDYQESAIANTGKPYEEWVRMSEKLRIASGVLNQLWHMESDLINDLKYTDEGEDIFNPDQEFHFCFDEEMQ